MFEGLKIPRAHAPVMATGSSSGSEGPLISDTLPSDYPSESHSEIEDVDTRSLPVSSAGSFENKAYVQESYYSEGYGHTQEIQTAVAVVKEQPKFDVQVRVKRAPPPPPSPSLPSSDAESSIARTERNLSTILEQREESIRTIDSPPPSKTQFSYVPELHPPPKYIQPAPVYNRILRRQQELHESSQQAWDELDTARSLASLNTENTETHSVTEIVDGTHSRFVAPVPPPPPPIIPDRYVASQTIEIAETLPEPPISVYRKPEITSHVVDDVFLRTITEKRTIEDIERHKRLVTEYHTRPRPIEDQKWDVTIRNYPGEMPEPPEWENFSDISSASGLTLTPKPERAMMSLPPQSRVEDNKTPLFSPELVGNIDHHATTREMTRDVQLAQYDLPVENPQVPNWDVLIRVFQPLEEQPQSFDDTESISTQLTTNDKIKWRKIITTESTLRSLLTEAVVREDFERIRYDERYDKIFEPPKWDVIIRILAPPATDKQPSKNQRFKKKSEWDTRSRRSSLPTLYEYDSDGGSSARTLTQEPALQPIHHVGDIPHTSRRTSRSSYRGEVDMRSMSEMTVDFARPDNLDSQSESSSYYPGAGRYYEDSEPDSDVMLRRSHSLTRSLSQPSLARSASEFTERWIAPRYDTGSEFTSPETTPKSQRSTRIQPVHVPRPPTGTSSSTMEAQQWQASGRMPGGGHVSTQVTSQYMETSTSFRSKDWFADNDSEASFK